MNGGVELYPIQPVGGSHANYSTYISALTLRHYFNRSASSGFVPYLLHICDRYRNEAKFLSVADMLQILSYRYFTDIPQD